MELLKKIIKGICAGISIGIGAVAYLACAVKGQPIIGACMFSVGILVVMEFKFSLFTGFVPTAKKMPVGKYILDSFIVMASNFVGAAGLALLIYCTRIYDTFKDLVGQMVETKLNDNLLSVFILSILCGILIAMIVKAKEYKKHVLYVVILIAVFILSSYEHVVANSFYVVFAFKLFTTKGLLFMLVNFVGNFVGGLAYSYVDYLQAVNKEKTLDTKDIDNENK